MSEDPQFQLDLETDPLVPVEESESESTVQAPPVVMIQYRNRGMPPVLLFPMTLILSLGMFAAYHYLFVAPRQRELQEQARAQAAASATTKAEVTEVQEEPPPMALSLDSQPLPPGFLVPPSIIVDAEATRVVAKPIGVPGTDTEPSIWEELNGDSMQPSTAKAVASSPVEPPKEAAPSLSMGFIRPSDETPAEPPKELALAPVPATSKGLTEPDVVKPDAALLDPPKPKPTPTPEEMQRTFEAEAEAKRLALEKQERLKQEARVQVENEAQNRVEDERALFREDLKRIVSAGGSSAGQEIDELCDKYGRTYSGDVKAQVLAAMSRYHGRVSREVEVRILRSLGVPEPGILDFLANGLHRSINSRNGPRDPDSVRVYAAKQLLRTKLLMDPALGSGSPARRSVATGRVR